MPSASDSGTATAAAVAARKMVFAKRGASWSATVTISRSPVRPYWDWKLSWLKLTPKSPLNTPPSHAK